MNVNDCFSHELGGDTLSEYIYSNVKKKTKGDYFPAKNSEDLIGEADDNEDEEEDAKLIATFNVVSIEEGTKILYSPSAFTSIEIDGVIQPEVISEYVFNTLGEHVVKYELADKTNTGSRSLSMCPRLISVVVPKGVIIIEEGTFAYNAQLSSMVIPEGVTTIGSGAFMSTDGLHELTLPSSIISIGNSAFLNSDCIDLTSLATTAPTLGNQVFDMMSANGTLTVPAGSTGYDAWLSKLPNGWTIVEQ